MSHHHHHHHHHNPNQPTTNFTETVTVTVTVPALPREEGGWGGDARMCLWSDPQGRLAAQFGLYDSREGVCMEGVVILDGQGVARHVMTTR